jgi:hypothetical protein
MEFLGSVCRPKNFLYDNISYLDMIVIVPITVLNAPLNPAKVPSRTFHCRDARAGASQRSWKIDLSLFAKIQ